MLKLNSKTSCGATPHFDTSETNSPHTWYPHIWYYQELTDYHQIKSSIVLKDTSPDLMTYDPLLWFEYGFT